MSRLYSLILLLILCVPAPATAQQWDAESWSNACSTQLDQLKKILLQHEPITPLMQPNTQRETATFQARLNNWLLGINSERLAFKITSITQLDHSTLKTTVLCAAFGKNAEHKRVERHSQWQITWDNSQPVPRITHTTSDGYEETIATQPKPLFRESTAQLFSNCPAAWQQLRTSAPQWLNTLSSEVTYNQNFYQGISVADVNGDGLDDLFVCQGDGLPNRLLLQQADGTLHDHTSAAGLDMLDRSSCALFVDFDNDGDADLALGTRKALLIFSNDGKAHFQLSQTLLDHHPSITSLSAGDYDSDGLTDLFVCNYHNNESLSRFSNRPAPENLYDAQNGGPNSLFRNVSRSDHGINFKDVTQSSGLSTNNNLFSFTSTWHDYDDDGDLDLYVANDFGRNNFYRNNQGKFTDIVDESKTQDLNFSMNASWGDWNRDGKSDLYVSNMFSSAGRRVTYQKDFKTHIKQEERKKFQHLAHGNSLFTQQTDQSFQEDSVAQHVWLGRWAWGAAFADLDHNGWQDLAVANGYLTNTLDDDL